MSIGDTSFLGNPRNSKPHLYVIISRPLDDKVLCVNFSTNYPRQPDTACTFEPGDFDFPFIKRSTYIAYTEAKEIDVMMIQTNLRGRRWFRGDAVPEEMLNKIQAGAIRSAFLPGKFRKYLSPPA